jgi:hypothetical protein
MLLIDNPQNQCNIQLSLIVQFNLPGVIIIMFLVTRVDVCRSCDVQVGKALGVFDDYEMAKSYLVRNNDFASLVITEVESNINLTCAPLAVEGYRLQGNLKYGNYHTKVKMIFPVSKLLTTEIAEDDLSDYLIGTMELMTTYTYIGLEDYLSCNSIYQALRRDNLKQIVDKVVSKTKAILHWLEGYIVVLPDYENVQVIIRIIGYNYMDVVLKKDIIGLEVIGLKDFAKTIMHLNAQDQANKLQKFIKTIAEHDPNY